MVRSWSVTARGQASVQVMARNWIVALGRGLEELGKAAELQRLACEVLPNGTVIARDVTSGTGYVVQVISGPDPQQTPPTAEDLVRPDDPTAQSPMQLPEADDQTAEEASAEQIFELPQPAARDLAPHEAPGWPILQSESLPQACDRAIGAARAASGAESGAVILVERGYLRFVAASGPSAPKLLGLRLPLGTGVAGFALESKRAIVLSDAHSDPRHCGEVDTLTGYITREIAVVPLVLDGVALGVLELMNLPEGRRFTKEDMDKLIPLAEALAIRTAR